jgi:hypothetical protein
MWRSAGGITIASALLCSFLVLGNDTALFAEFVALFALPGELSFLIQ